MTCEDCVHHDLCFDNGTLFINFTTTGRKAENVETNCPFKNFKNKADFVEVKHGEWESFEIPHMIRCSKCGVSDLAIHRTKFDFCPYCGAKMDGTHGKHTQTHDNARTPQKEG